MTLGVMQTVWVPIFKVTLRAEILQKLLFHIFWTFATKHGIVVHHHKELTTHINYNVGLKYFIGNDYQRHVTDLASWHFTIKLQIKVALQSQ